MLFMLVGRPRPGVKREQVIERLTREMHPDTWDLFRHGKLSHILYKTDEAPGFFAVLEAPDEDEAEALVKRSTERVEVLDIEVVPVKQFPQFD